MYEPTFIKGVVGAALNWICGVTVPPVVIRNNPLKLIATSPDAVALITVAVSWLIHVPARVAVVVLAAALKARTFNPIKVATAVVSGNSSDVVQVVPDFDM
ncbi:hypothetical protein bcgnr5376_59070 [Bacillus cereus]